MNDADDGDDSYNSGTAQQVFEWRVGGGGLFLAPLFLSNYFLFNLFLLLQKTYPQPLPLGGSCHWRLTK